MAPGWGCRWKIKPALAAQLFKGLRSKDPRLSLILKHSQPWIRHQPPIFPLLFWNNIHTLPPLVLAAVSISLSDFLSSLLRSR